MATLPTYVLKITSGRDPRCSRTIEFRGDRTLTHVHGAIQREFDLDDDHLWSFFLSGEIHDRATEFTDAREGHSGRSPDVRLDTLDLEAGMRFRYLFDYGDCLVHDLEVVRVGEIDIAATEHRVPLVLAREGTPPPQYPDADSEPAIEDDDDEPADKPLDPASEKALAAVLSLKASLNSETNLDAGEALAQVRTVLDAAPAPESMARLAVTLGDRGAPLYWSVSRALDDLIEAKGPEAALLELADRWARLTGEWADLARWAQALAAGGKAQDAMARVAAFAATGPAADERDCLLAWLLSEAGRLEEAEAALKKLTARRWLSGRVRRRCEKLLDGVLRATGRTAEADLRQDRAAERAGSRAGTIAFKGPKPSPNDRCFCGSGKKFKRCCGAR